MQPPLPRFIGICGNPKAGKSLVQAILGSELGYTAIDDGFVLREFAVEKLGLTWDDVITQEGKLRSTEILGKEWNHRDLLGTFGKQLEDMFGEHIMPYLAMRNCDPVKHYTFGSVRKTQGEFIRSKGGVMIEVLNPLAPPSGYAFDWYDPASIDITIENDGLQRFNGDAKNAYLDLEKKVIAAMTQIQAGASTSC